METAVMEMMRMMRNNENSRNGEGTISDDDMNLSGGVCWMSLIMRRTGAYFVCLSTRAVYRVFILLCEYLTRLFSFCTYKGNEKVDIGKMMT
jgi:hypothetical protein